MLSSASRVVQTSILVCALAATSLAEPLDGREVVDDVFYQFMPIAWRDSDNDTYRFGDFDGMTDSLEYLSTIGVTAVWMNPIFPSAAYHGYQHGPGDELNTRFGSEPEFLNFVSEAHARGIKVFVDYVVYGISQDTVWFQSAYGNPASPYDTWLAFENSGNTQYLGSTYNTWNGDQVGFIHWNLDNPNPTNLVTGWTQHWLDPNNDMDPSDGIDGYRLDHVWNTYPNGPNGWGYNIDWWEDWNAALESVNPDVFIFAEQADWGSTGADLSSAFDAAFTKPFEFAARNALATGSASGLYSSMAATLGSLPPGKLFMGIIGDHDVDRLASSIGDSLTKGRAAAAVLLTQPFPPIIYYGDEIGMRGIKGNYGSDANDIPMREPFKWNAVAGPPMSNYWILNGPAYNNRYAQNNDGRSVEEQMDVPGSLLEHYRTLIAARKNNVALRRGSYHAVSTSSGAVWSFLRHVDGEQTVLVAINLSNATVNLTADLSIATINGASSTVHDVIANANLATNLTTSNQAAYPLTLAPYGYYILEVNVTPDAPSPQVVDGDLIANDLGPQSLRATQTNYTSMGDNVSELNQLYANLDATKLSVGITGNLATDGTGLALFLDTHSGGQNTLDTASFSQPPGGIPQVDGMVLDSGFAADFIVFVNAFSGSIYVDLYELSTGGGGVKTYLGSGTVGDGDGFLNGGNNPNGAEIAINNSNLAGVTASSADQAGTAVTGIEMSLPLADLDVAPPDGRIRMMAMLVRSNGNVGNQFLPGLSFGTGSLGFVPINLNTEAGTQYASIVIAPQPGDWDSDGDVDLADYAHFVTCITGPTGGALGPGCITFDFDADLDVDMEDAAEFCREFNP
ncbi:MAG: alpha-glucosidase C-terminal domain-containing protein [Phycisphaerales bacterium]|nr:alpha-glucosidase C-terminal domain-containing protein [Phycisphaerales bacterium]